MAFHSEGSRIKVCDCDMLTAAMKCVKQRLNKALEFLQIYECWCLYLFIVLWAPMLDSRSVADHGAHEKMESRAVVGHWTLQVSERKQWLRSWCRLLACFSPMFEQKQWRARRASGRWWNSGMLTWTNRWHKWPNHECCSPFPYNILKTWTTTIEAVTVFTGTPGNLPDIRLKHQVATTWYSHVH